MPKKIFDIIPPAHRQETKPSLPESKITLERPRPGKKHSNLWWGIIPLGLILFLGLGFKISKVEIQIWPETETLTFKTKVTIDKTIENQDVNFWIAEKVLPGQIFEVEKTVSEEFSSSGKILKKAEGVIRLYNSYSTQPETWLEGTRFVSADGKLFKSKSKILVPGATIKNGKITPSSVDVSVIAAEPGSDYNIGPSNFSIIALRGTPKYTKYYGESFQPMAGGGEFPQVTKEDIENAQNLLIEKVKTESENALKEKIPVEFLFSKEIVETKILDKFSLSQPGAEVEKFISQVKAKSTTLSFNKEKLNSFTKQFILSQIPTDKNIFEESLKIEYLPETFNLEAGNANLNLNFSTKVYPVVDLVSLKNNLVGKDFAETKIFLENQPYVLQTQIRFFPFWVRNVPKDIDKIDIKYPLID